MFGIDGNKVERPTILNVDYLDASHRRQSTCERSRFHGIDVREICTIETPVPIEAMWAPSLSKQPSAGAILGRFRIAFENTTLSEVMLAVLGGTVLHKGDAGGVSIGCATAIPELAILIGSGFSQAAKWADQITS